MKYRRINHCLHTEEGDRFHLEIRPSSAQPGYFWGFIATFSGDRRLENTGATVEEVMDKIEDDLLEDDPRLDWVSYRYARLKVGDARVGYLQETEATEGIPSEWRFRIQRDYGGGTYAFGTDRRACIVAALAKLDYIEEKVIL